MHFTSELQTPITFLFVNENIKCEYACSYFEHYKYFGTKLVEFALFFFAFSAPPFSVEETLHVAYKNYKIKRKLTFLFGKYQIYFIL